VSKLHHPQAGLLLIRQKTQVMIPLQKDLTTIGRRQADIILDDPKVSSSHAEIRKEEGQYVFLDMGSTNGSFVNRRPASKVPLVDQDVIEIGMTTLCFFADTRDFHGEIVEVTNSVKSKPLTQITKSKDLTTTSQTLLQPQLEILILQGESPENRYLIRKPHIVIGRGEVDVPILDPYASRRHAMIEVLSDKNIFIRDMGSTNGTYVNQVRIEHQKISPDDEIKIGETLLKYKLGKSPKEDPE